ncbi:hypothetical protein Asp14428_04220 [Actinoplanes sp. NBRC 14428]|nr:hypothetical protein Asp14428_04220 [Actinoplanes sp. NBRC 14428]
MFATWGAWVARFRWAVLAVAVIAVTAAGVWGMGVFGQLSEGGYTDPGSESSRAAEVVREALGPQGGDVVAIYRPGQGSIDDPALGRRIEARLAALPKSSVTAVAGYWPGRAGQFAAADRRSAVAVLTLAGEDEGEKLEAFREIGDKLSVAGATVQLAGGAPLGDASAARSTEDLAFAEAVSLPIVLILLLFIFGSLVAASLPVLVGGCAVLGSLGCCTRSRTPTTSTRSRSTWPACSGSAWRSTTGCSWWGGSGRSRASGVRRPRPWPGRSRPPGAPWCSPRRC